MPDELCGDPDVGPVEYKAFTNCSGFLSDVPDIGPVELVAFVNCTGFVNPDPAVFDLIMVNLGGCPCCPVCYYCCAKPPFGTPDPLDVYLSFSGGCTDTITSGQVTYGEVGDEKCWTLGGTADCAGVMGGWQVQICCNPQGGWSWEVQESADGGYVHTQSGIVDKVICQAEDPPNPDLPPWFEFSVVLDGLCCNGQTLTAVFTMGSPQPPEPPTPPELPECNDNVSGGGAMAASAGRTVVSLALCDYLGDPVSGYERSRLGLDHAKDWRYCELGRGVNGIICGCLNFPIGCKGCPDLSINHGGKGGDHE